MIGNMSWEEMKVSLQADYSEVSPFRVLDDQCMIHQQHADMCRSITVGSQMYCKLQSDHTTL